MQVNEHNTVEGTFAELRDEFILPTFKGMGAKRMPESAGTEPCTYLCGNSLGPLPKRSKALVNEEMQVWADRAVEGHFDHPHGRDWVRIADHCVPLVAEIVGAKEHEVACMSTLTANLHLMMNTFYKPTAERFKILCEAKAFPSDQYAFASQAKAHGYDPAEAVVELSPRAGEFALREEDILHAIEADGASIALVLFSGVQYYTGQLFPMASITRAAKNKGCICGWDLAHAIGNVPLSLHDWEADFAVWCTYKYLNSGAGGIAGLYIHEKWDDSISPKYAGWYGHDLATRFAMPPVFKAIRGAQGFIQSNPPMFATASLLGALQVFKRAGMVGPLRARSLVLTGALEEHLHRSRYFVPLEDALEATKVGFTIITPSDPAQRGAQLSLLFLPASDAGVMHRISEGLMDLGVVGDKREPNVIRLAPAPLFNTLEDCARAAKCLEQLLDELV